jgi:hypothetical protein
MILKYHHLLGIKSGKITLAFRKWKRPSVKTGGTLLTEMGVIRIVEVSPASLVSITDAEARKAGYATRDEVIDQLSKFDEGKVYRVRMKYESEDPRIGLREQTSLSDVDFQKLVKRLERLDQASKTGPWTRQYMRLIGKYPERRAGDLADMIHMDKFEFKINVRKLKNLGLTVSHDIGYSISPLGNWVLDNWRG